MSDLPFPNLKLTYTPPRVKYEWKVLLYHAYTFVEFFANIDSLEFVAKSQLIIPSLNFVF
jgi:hypothetical protein